MGKRSPKKRKRAASASQIAVSDLGEPKSIDPSVGKSPDQKKKSSMATRNFVSEMEALLEKFKLTDVASRMTTIENTLNASSNTLVGINTTVTQQSAAIQRIEGSLSATNERVASVERNALRAKIDSIQALNYTQQELKLSSIRIVGLNTSASIKFPEQIAQHAFDSLLKHIIVKFESNLKDFSSYISYAFRTSNRTPPAIIVTFHSRFVRDAVMRCKAKAFKEMQPTFDGVSIFPDLTPINQHILKVFKAYEPVEKAFFNGRIRYKLANDARTHTLNGLTDPIIRTALLQTVNSTVPGGSLLSASEPHAFKLLRESAVD